MKGRLETFGRTELEVRGKVVVVWWDGKPSFLRAVVNIGQFPVQPVVPSSLNFKFKHPRSLECAGQAGNNPVLRTTLSARVYLTEEQIFSFHWKADRLYMDNTDEKALSRHLTAFIKTVR